MQALSEKGTALLAKFKKFQKLSLVLYALAAMAFVFAGNILQAVYPLISRVCGEQEQVVDCALNRDLDGVFNAFAADPNMCISVSDARKLFDEMGDNTKEYLKMYF